MKVLNDTALLSLLFNDDMNGPEATVLLHRDIKNLLQISEGNKLYFQS